MNGAELISEERRRQIEKEGWTPEHDDSHSPGTLAVAGASYALGAAGALSENTFWSIQYKADGSRVWPFDSEWRKPKDPVRDLVRAGALIAAEIDRIERKGP